MEKQLMAHLQVNERKDYLKDSADRVEEFNYTKPFTAEQMQVFKDQLAPTMIRLNQLEDELNEVKSQYKEKMQPLKDEIKILLTNIKNKAEFVNEECFVIIEGTEAGYYNSEGTLVYSRPLLPGEAQKTIFSIKREGTNN